jgi:hypothetical protein
MKNPISDSLDSSAPRGEWVRPAVRRMSAGSAEDGAKPDFVDSGQKPS